MQRSFRLLSGKRKLVFFCFVGEFGGARHSDIFLFEKLRKYYDVQVIDVYGSCKPYIDALAERRVPTHVLAPDMEPIVVGHYDNVFKRVSRVVRCIGALLTIRRRFIRKILEAEPDVVWTSCPKSLAFLATSWRLRKYPAVMFARAWYKRYQVSAWKRWAIKHRTNCVLAVSNQTKEAMAGWGVKKEKIHVAFDALDFDRIAEASVKEPCEVLPGQDRAFKILVPGQLTRTKGQHTAIEAASILNDKGLDFVMWLAGRVSAGDMRNYDVYLKRLISENGLEEKVFLLGWRPDIYALMRLVDIVVFPTHTEGFPRVILEAMFLKRPVISTPVGGVVDLIVDGETGLLGPVDDERVLAEHIERLMGDNDLVTRITQEAHKRVLDRFSAEKLVESVKSAFEDVLRKARTNEVHSD